MLTRLKLDKRLADLKKNFTQHFRGQLVPSTLTKSITLFGKTFFISKTGVLLERIDGRLSLMTGGSCKFSKDLAEFISTCEFAERLFSSYEAQKEFNDLNNYHLKRLGSDKILRKIDYKEVILGPINNIPSINDASGIAWHFTKKESIKHALNELVERHFLAELWWGDGGLKPIKIDLDGQNIIEFYSITLGGVVSPVVVAVLRDKNVNFLVIGSCCNESLQIAIQNSLKEAIMLFSNIDSIKTADNILESQRRIETLENPELSKQRYDHLTSKIIRNTNINLDQINPPFYQEACYVELGSPFGVLIRAYLPNTKQIRKSREQYSNFLSDPYC